MSLCAHPQVDGASRWRRSTVRTLWHLLPRKQRGQWTDWLRVFREAVKNTAPSPFTRNAAVVQRGIGGDRAVFGVLNLVCERAVTIGWLALLRQQGCMQLHVGPR